MKSRHFIRIQKPLSASQSECHGIPERAFGKAMKPSNPLLPCVRSLSIARAQALRVNVQYMSPESMGYTGADIRLSADITGSIGTHDDNWSITTTARFLVHEGDTIPGGSDLLLASHMNRVFKIAKNLLLTLHWNIEPPQMQ